MKSTSLRQQPYKFEPTVFGFGKNEASSLFSNALWMEWGPVAPFSPPGECFGRESSQGELPGTLREKGNLSEGGSPLAHPRDAGGEEEEKQWTDQTYQI